MYWEYIIIGEKVKGDFRMKYSNPYAPGATD